LLLVFILFGLFKDPSEHNWPGGSNRGASEQAGAQAI
jgi:hypothetical protein